MHCSEHNEMLLFIYLNCLECFFLTKKKSTLGFVFNFQAQFGCRILLSNSSAAKSTHTNTLTHLQVRLQKTTEPRWSTAGRKAESAALASSESRCGAKTFRKCKKIYLTCYFVFYNVSGGGRDVI